MKLVGVSLLALAVVLTFPRPSAAQNKTARGTVSSVAGDTITVNVGGTEMKFAADSKTMVTAAGAGTKSRAAAAAGQPGPKLTDLLKAGEAVVVTYMEMGSMNHATSVQVVTSAGPGGGSVAGDKPASTSKSADGVVKSVSATSLTVTSGGKDMTFALDQSTRVVGTGAGTKTAAAGGRIVITDLVATGNRVNVTYSDAGGTMKATEVRVISAK
jgi:ribosome maturation factor RimP